MQDILDALKGWQRVLQDKCLKNELTEMHLVNLPDALVKWKERMDAKGKILIEEDCSTFVYAEYLPPGLHQLIIYCPKTQRAFCKEFIVDLNQCDSYPDMPHILKEVVEVGKPKKMPKSNCNVWRKWRHDTPEQIQEAFENDVVFGSFAPELFLNDQDDIDECKQILHDNFLMLQTAYITMLAQSVSTYPEISASVFI